MEKLNKVHNSREADYDAFQRDLTHLINYYSLENESNTPDIYLAQYLVDCLKAYNKSSLQIVNWMP